MYAITYMAQRCTPQLTLLRDIHHNLRCRETYTSTYTAERHIPECTLHREMSTTTYTAQRCTPQLKLQRDIHQNVHWTAVPHNLPCTEMYTTTYTAQRRTPQLTLQRNIHHNLHCREMYPSSRSGSPVVFPCTERCAAFTPCAPWGCLPYLVTPCRACQDTND